MSKISNTILSNLLSNPSIATFNEFMVDFGILQKDATNLNPNSVEYFPASENNLRAVVSDTESSEENEFLPLGRRAFSVSDINKFRHKAKPLSRKEASELFSVLIKYCGETKESKLKKKAVYSLLIFYHLVIHDGNFQDVVQEQHVSKLKDLHLDQHFEEGNDFDKSTIVKLIYFLSTNFARFERWKRFVPKTSVQQEIAQQIENLDPTIKESLILSEMRLPPSGQYYDVNVDEILRIFHVDERSGLSASDVILRREKYGINQLPKDKRPSIFWIFCKQLFDFMVIILLVTALIAGILQEFKATIVLGLVIVFNVAVGFFQEVKAEIALSKLMKLNIQQAKVLREGTIVVLNAEEIVPGDVVILEEGNQVPADVRLIEEIDLHTVEALLTGESEPIEKNVNMIFKSNVSIGDRKNMAYMSTVVSKGRGKGVVVATGKNTEIGKISKSLSMTKTLDTPLQKKLRVLGVLFVIISVLLCSIVVCVGVIWGNTWMDMIKVGVSLAVSVIPEGLVAVTTITMSLGVQRMTKKHAIVRKLPAVETLGSVTVICSDKTGTLTAGKMKLKNIKIGPNEYDLQERGNQSLQVHKNGTEVISTDYDSSFKSILQTCALCNNAVIKMHETASTENTDNQKISAIGDSTETALLIAAYQMGYSKERIVQEQHLLFENEFAFDSERKRMSVVYTNNTSLESQNETYFVFAKGAPESVLNICSFVRQEDKNFTLDEDRLRDIESDAMKLSSQGLRVLAIATKSVLAKDIQATDISQVEQGLVFLGLVGVLDPPRENVFKSIETCRQSGIRVSMITGDHPTTACAIAKRIGIIQEDDNETKMVLQGKDIDQLVVSNQFRSLNPFPVVFARVSPENKLQIVQTLQQRGEVVAMIGDGVNDAASIKKSNVGVAMGLSGTDLAKNNASIILSDDNFQSVVNAVEEGRRTYDNIQKFIMYLLSCNFAEILLMLITVCAGTPTPFSSIQILYANLVADTPPALSLGVEPQESNIMRRKPRNPKAGVFSLVGWISLVYQGVVMCSIALAGFYISIFVEKVELSHARTFTFTLLTVVQLLHSFHCRSLLRSIFTVNPLTNIWLYLAFLFSFGMIIAGLYIPWINQQLELEPLWWWDWVKILIGIAVHFVLIEFMKYVFMIRSAIWNKWNEKDKYFAEL